MIHENVLELVGDTPLVRLRRIPTEGEVYVKLESQNPGGSVKDRIALAMIEDAEERGELKPGMTIVEPTSGNTGIGLAMVAAVKGYKAVFVMPDTLSIERRALMAQYGAEIVLTEGKLGMKGAMAKAEEILAKGDHYMPLQFANPANPRVHERTTAKEIIRSLKDAEPDFFVAGVGTGGTVAGAGLVLKQRYPDIKIIAVEPEDSPVLSGGKPGPHKIQGIGAGFVPGVYREEIVDEVITARYADAIEMSRRLAKEEGILAGISSGANVAVALEKAKGGKRVVTLVCDTGERYLSTELFGEQDD
ncbi:MAG: cysteine synthase A [archaeon]